MRKTRDPETRCRSLLSVPRKLVALTIRSKYLTLDGNLHLTTISKLANSNKFFCFWVLLPSTSKQHFLDATLNISIIRKLGAPRFEPGAAG